MLTFLRRIRKSLIESGSVRKYLLYAIGEIVLVMIGILLAVQVNNWNIDRTNRITEIKYLKNIKLDLQKDLASLTYSIEFRKTKYIGIKNLIEQIRGKPTEDVTELTLNVLNSLDEERFTPNRTTFNEMSSSGNLKLISSDSIKTLLLELEELYNQNRVLIEHETYDYREYVSKPLFKYADIDQIVQVFEGKTVDEMNITKATFKNLFQDSEYKNGLVITNEITQYFILFYEQIEDKSKRLIALIDTSLK